MKFVGVTSCPTGIAHSEMAAEALEVAAKKAGHEIEMEVQGASGAPPMDPQKIQDADAVIFAVDADVRDRDRFSHLPKVEVGTRHAIDKAGQVVEQAEQKAQEAGAGAADADADTDEVVLVAVTSCPTGIAHSEMAAEALEVAAKKAGYEMTTEVQGASGAPPMDPSVIERAGAVIFAVDADVRERDRFSHLPKVEVGTRHAIDKAGQVVEQAAEKAREQRGREPVGAPAGAGGGSGARARSGGSDGGGGSRGAGAEVRRWLMTGVSYMIPFVVAGGILVALAFALGDAVGVTGSNVYENFTIPAMLYKIGSLGLSMLVPILAGFIAYSMADRPGIAPGLIGGLIANEIGAGFLGAIAAGLLAGFAVNAMKKIPAKGAVKRILPILVFPVVGSLVVGAAMIVVIGEPIAALTSGLEDWLSGLQGAGSIVLGIVIGSMMAFDLGGPINKTAYAFGLAALDAGQYAPMAAVMAAGMTPPLALALSTRIRPKLYTDEEREAGDAGWLMGASFITEGAIPFAASDPLRVIPAMMVGSSVAAIGSLLIGATFRAPHGGIWVIGLIGNWPMYLLMIAIGTVVSAVLVTVLKSMGRSDEDVEEETDAETGQQVATA